MKTLKPWETGINILLHRSFIFLIFYCSAQRQTTGSNSSIPDDRHFHDLDEVIAEMISTLEQLTAPFTLPHFAIRIRPILWLFRFHRYRSDRRSVQSRHFQGQGNDERVFKRNLIKVDKVFTDDAIFLCNALMCLQMFASWRINV